MDMNRRDFLKTGSLAALMVGLPLAVENQQPRPSIRWRSQHPTISADPAVHLLRRLSFGPTRAELERVRAMGITDWIEEQLHPENIDDSALDLRLAIAYPTLDMSIDELREIDPPNQVLIALNAATVERALYSKRQLFEVLVDHWSNHFNVDMRSGGCRFSKTWEDREVMRKHALGRFRDLLGADAHSPCMLEYLDNRSSQVGAPNENYGRELLELHTLGADGGYDETDVKEVARAFTGWSTSRRSGEFLYRPRWHDTEPKEVLGHSLPGGRGMVDGEDVLDIVAAHESTSHHVSYRLCQRLVADTPPDDVVTAAAQTFRDADGDLRAVVRTILRSDAFWASSGQKIRRPFELVAAAVRTLEVEAAPGRGLAFWLYILGQGLFIWPTPDGYPDEAQAWVNTDALVKRWNYGLALAEGRIRNISPDYPDLTADLPDQQAETLVDFFLDLILHQTILPDERQQLIDFLHSDDGPFDSQNPAHRARVPSLAGLIIDSPYFQWR